ncbi:MAG: type II toxin-antitoxin system RelE/ParE family toxin [Thermodesulfobacteriota bacterium]
MPKARVVFYCEADGAVPVLDWLDALPDKVKAKCLVRIERLKEQGHELRRPEADYLRDGIYELRVGYRGVNYRMLYFFHGMTAAVVSQGLPPIEIRKALERKKKFERDPKRHTLEGF